jgi:hypothetical protein
VKSGKRPSAANDNARIGATRGRIAPEGAGSHVYVYGGESEPAEAGTGSPDYAPIRKAQPSLTIVTNLPETVPILPGEIATIRGFMGDLVARILANDNDPD